MNIVNFSTLLEKISFEDKKRQFSTLFDVKITEKSRFDVLKAHFLELGWGINYFGLKVFYIESWEVSNDILSGFKF